MDENNWAKAENPEVDEAVAAFNEAQQAENPKPEVDPYDEAQQAEKLRHQLGTAADLAVRYGHVDREWINTWLAYLGVATVTGQSRYQINVPITGRYGTTVYAANRAEALAKFNRYAAEVAGRREFRGGGYGQGIFELEFSAGDPGFFSGPQDPPETAEAPGLDGLKTGIQEMLRQGVTEQGWGYAYAQGFLAAAGLPALPALHDKTVAVPVTGTAQVTVPVFADADSDAVQSAAVAKLGRAGQVVVKPEEFGAALMPRSADSMGLTLVDDEDGGDEPY